MNCEHSPTVKQMAIHSPDGCPICLAAERDEAVALLRDARRHIDTLTVQGKGCTRDIDALLAKLEAKP